MKLSPRADGRPAAIKMWKFYICERKHDKELLKSEFIKE